MSDEQMEIVEWVHRFRPFMGELEALKTYAVYMSLREEGQSSEVSRQYAGLM